jgi:DNA-binding NarL/FixJ family response regulator
VITPHLPQGKQSSDSQTLDRSGFQHPAIQNLTPRQRQVLLLISEGLSTKAIATRLRRTEKRISQLKRLLIQRLAVSSEAELNNSNFRQIYLRR